MIFTIIRYFLNVWLGADDQPVEPVPEPQTKAPMFSSSDGSSKVYEINNVTDKTQSIYADNGLLHITGEGLSRYVDTDYDFVFSSSFEWNENYSSNNEDFYIEGKATDTEMTIRFGSIESRFDSI